MANPYFSIEHLFAFCKRAPTPNWTHTTIASKLSVCFNIFQYLTAGGHAMSEQSSAEIRHREDDLDAAYNTIRMLGDTAHRHEEEARHMRLVAQLLSAELAPLRAMFDPVREHHTTDAWEGNAAIASRRRLDEHEDRCLNAIRTLDTLIDDLEQAAAVAARASDRAHDEADSARRTATLLERELEELHALVG
jgi:uncharacterized protein YukE